MTTNKGKGLGSWVLGLGSFFTEIPRPRRAISIGPRQVTVASVAKKGGGKAPVRITSAAIEPIPPGLIEPRLTEINIKDKDRLSELVRQALEKAGLLRERRWSLAIPRRATRTFIIQLDEVPRKKQELAQMLQWKVERLLEVSMSDLTASFQRLRPVNGHPRFLVVAAVNDILASYEAVLSPLKIKPGFVIPDHLAETAWLHQLRISGFGMRNEETAKKSALGPRPSALGRDALLITADGEEVTFMFLRGDDFLSIRSVDVGPGLLADEIHRTLVYYLDKLAPPIVADRQSLVASEKAVASDEQPATSDQLGREPQLNTVLLIGDGLDPHAVGASCQALFPSDCLPTIRTLRQPMPEDRAGGTVEKISSATGLAIMGL